MCRMQRTCCLITAGGWVRSTRRLSRRRPRDPRASPPPSTHYTTAAHCQGWEAARPQLSPPRHLRLQAGVCDHIMPKSICCRHAVSRVPPVRAHWVVRFSLLFSTLFGFIVGHQVLVYFFPLASFTSRGNSATAKQSTIIVYVVLFREMALLICYLLTTAVGSSSELHLHRHARERQLVGTHGANTTF